jgi:peptide/nickel transport system permease protein
VRTARAKGVRERTVLWVHGLRNAAAPLTQLFGLSLPFLVSGALVVELVFSWPGVGRLTWMAIGSRDYPVMLATTALGALLVVIGTTAADLLLGAIDPRVRHDG